MPPYRRQQGRIAWHQRLDARVTAGVTLIAGVALLSVLMTTGGVLTTHSLERSREDLLAARVAFNNLVDTRARSASAEVRLVVDLPKFRAMMPEREGAPVISGLTLDGITDDYCRKLNATFCVVTDGAGTWTSRAGLAPASAADVPALGRVMAASRGGQSANDIVTAGDRLLLVVSEPAMFGDVEVIGTFTVAYRLDDGVARELALVTSSDVTFVCGDRMCGTSLRADAATALGQLLATHPDALGAIGDAAADLRTIGANRYVGGRYPLRPDEDRARPEATLVLLQDWAPTEHAIDQLYAVLASIGGLAFGVALLGGLVFSRRMTRPLRELAVAADDIAGGNWRRNVDVRGPAEARTMADAFNHMAASIAHWHDEADVRARRLAETYERFRSVTESANDAIISANTQGRILFWSRRACAVFGYTEDDAIGRPLTSLFPERHVDAFTRAIDELHAQGGKENGRTIELHGLDRSGREVPIELSLSTWMVDSAICYTAVIRDITERQHAAAALKQRDEQLRQAQKMEAVGRLAGGVAHDFNNLLTAILGYADLALDTLGPDDPIRRQIVEIRKAGLSAASLTRGLLAFSRKQVLQPVVLDLNAVVANAEDLLRRLIGEDVELVVALEPSLASVKADPAQVEQVLVNLAVNARDAMPAGGRLTIATVNLDESATRARVPGASGPGVAIVVRDSGVGMTEDVRARVFEPFFTTKGAGHGTGLGLASVYGAVTQSGGHVWVDSTPDAGATFTVCLPAVTAQPERIATAEREKDTRYRGTETVLLVEDNDAVREMARETLAGYGYTVLEAANGRDALRLAAPLIDRISLVLTDVVMPLMGGAELAVRLRTMRPDIKFVFASGYASDPVPGPPASSPKAAFLQKPFSPAALGRTVRQVLDANPELVAR